VLRPYYREYDLPWSASEQETERFRKILLITLLALLLFGIVVPLLPTPKRSQQQAEEVRRVWPG